MCVSFILFFKQKTAYEMRISDWSSDVCSSDLLHGSQPDVFVVCHDPARKVILGMESFALPSVEEVIELTIRLGSRTNPAIRCGGISLNTASLGSGEAEALLARKSVGAGKRVSVRVDIGGRRIIKKKSTARLNIHPL